MLQAVHGDTTKEPLLKKKKHKKNKASARTNGRARTAMESPGGRGALSARNGVSTHALEKPPEQPPAKPAALPPAGAAAESAAAEGDEPPVTVLEPRSGWRAVDLRELWRHRELLFLLAYRDVMVRYKQTALGPVWAFAQPLATMLVFTLFLGRMGGLAEGVEHYPLFVFAGLVPWSFFSGLVSTAGASVVANEYLVKKVYFPRLIVPLSSAGPGLFDFLISLLVLAVMMAFYRVAPGPQVLLLPLIVLLLLAAAVGVGTLLAALTVAHRDFRVGTGFGLNLWMFATPSIYLSGDALSLGERAKAWLPLNPAQGLIYNFRRCLLGGELDWYALAVSGSVALALLAVGCMYFRRAERRFADVI